MAKVTVKAIQVHAHCACGSGEVYTEYVQLRFKDFKKWGIKKRKNCFYSMEVKSGSCGYCSNDE